MSSVPNSPQRGTQKPSKGRKTSTVTDRPSILSPTTIKTSPLATSLNIAAMSGSVIRAATTKEHGRTGKENGERGRKGSFRKSGKNRPPVPQNGAFINRRGSTSAALMSSSNSLWQTLVKTKHGPLAPMPGYDGMFMNLGPNGSKDNLFDDKKHKAKDKPPYDNIADDPKGSLIQRKKAALARRTNSLVELAVKAGKQPNERSDGNESTGSTHSSPLRPSLLRKDMRFCCSFRKPRRAKTASNLLDQHIQTNIPPFGVVNASAMSLINDPSVARQAISLLEAQMKPNPETVKMFTDEEKAVEEGMEVKRPHGLESITSPLRKLSKAFFNSQNNDRIDLMNDWEIGGTQNAWVCPSDRHLQLRAQLKSGWSVRTATARSPTTTKATAMNGISDAEQEQIRKVLARAEAGKQQEKERIGKMVDRLEKMRTRASGNGVTQCLICQTEFGLLASKSYAAMCSDCRKYVCQKNCGVETVDQKRGEPIFLCKLCSEYREVMWKKSGAWFYKEVPTYVKPCDSPASTSAYPPANGFRHSPNVPSAASPNNGWPSGYNPSPRASHGSVVSPPAEQNGAIPGAHNPPRQRQLPIPPDQQQRLKTTPRPRITPSWVHEKVQSSMSIGSEDEESSSSSIDAPDFKTLSNQVPIQAQPLPPSRRHHYRQRDFRHAQSPSQQPTTTSSSCASSSTAPRHIQRFAVSNRNPITDTEESENDESRRTTPSTSPRHSLATPSSFGGDDLSQNHITLTTNETSDAKSIDSGVVQSDHSMHQIRQVIPAAGAPAPQQLQPFNVTPTPMHNSSSSSSSPPPPNMMAGLQNLDARTHGHPGLEMRATGNQNPVDVRSLSLKDKHQHGNHTDRGQYGRAQPDPTSQYGRPADPTGQYGSLQSSTQNFGSSGTVGQNHGPHYANDAAGQHRKFSESARQTREFSQYRDATGAPVHRDSTSASGQYRDQTHSPYRESSTNSPYREGQKMSQNDVNQPQFGHPQVASQYSSQYHGQQNGPTTSPRNSNTVPSLFQPIPPPLPPRHGQSVGNVDRHSQGATVNPMNATVASQNSATVTPLNATVNPSGANIDRRPSSGSSSTNNSAFNKRQFQSNPNSSRESLNIAPGQSQLSLNSKPRPPSVHSTDRKSSITVGSRESLSLAPNETDRPIGESPTFMSSPEEDSSTLGSIQFNLTYLSEEKQLIIHLIRAKNLKAMDKNGFSDPYVKFHLIPGNVKATKLTSKTIEKTLNPEWNEEMIYYGITEDERLKKTLRVTVLDRDRIGSDFLGETRVALKKLPLGQTKKFNLYLEHAMPTPAEQVENAERGKILMSVCYNIQQACLFIHVKRCAELMGMDSSGFSDPYCKVSLTPLSSKQHRYKTAIKKRTLNPEFNEVIQFIVPFKDLPKKTLEIGVYDHDVGRHDDYIGGIVLSTAAKGDRGKQWTQCIENPGKTFEYWHKLETD